MFTVCYARLPLQVPERRAWWLSCGLWLALLPATASAWQVSLGNAQRRLFLHVGSGMLNADSGTVSQFTVDVQGPQLGNGPLPMTTVNGQSTSLLNPGITRCTSPQSQILIGASYQRQNVNNGSNSATLSVVSPAHLTNARGDTIPFSEIGWSVAGSADATPFTTLSGSFAPGTVPLAQVSANTYMETCHAFTYGNSAVYPAGTYTGTVTYTLSNP
jgi:hypothetical protein